MLREHGDQVARRDRLSLDAKFQEEPALSLLLAANFGRHVGLPLALWPADVVLTLELTLLVARFPAVLRVVGDPIPYLVLTSQMTPPC